MHGFRAFDSPTRPCKLPPVSKQRKLSLLSIVLILLGITALGARWLVSEDRIIELVEKHYDCECTVEDVSYSLFSKKVSITGLTLHDPQERRDFVTADSVGLEVSGILSDLVIESLALHSPTILYTVDAEGNANWKRLRRDKKKDKPEKEPRLDEDGRKIADEEIDIDNIFAANISDGTVIYENVAKNLVLRFENLSIQSEDATTGDLDIAFRLLASRANATAAFADLHATGSGHYRNEDYISLDLIFAPESHITREIPLLRHTWSKLIEWQRFIPKFDSLPERIDFRRERELKVDWRGDTLATRSSLPIKVGDYSLALREGAEFDTVTTYQSSTFLFSATPAATNDLLSKRGKLRLLPKQLRKPLIKLIERRYIKEEQLHIELSSSGHLNFSSFDLKKALPKLEDLIRESARDALLDLIR